MRVTLHNRLLKAIACVLVLLSRSELHADDARFDLVGPKIDVYVTRGASTLPIAEVLNLLAKDRLTIRAELPASQSNHFLLIVAFLRSATNEPPDDWFTRIETWKSHSSDGAEVTVPEGAQRALLFLAPETGGDFPTLRSAVKRNPGIFLRAAESLNKAALEQQRIQHYLAGMQSVATQKDQVILSRSNKLATALALKPDADCFKKPVQDQVDCLTQESTPLLLDDGHGTTAIDAISTGASSDFINEAGQADNGTYSAYVGTLVDLVHLITLLHTAQYRYIPAISFPQGPALNLRLNAPPSFNNPKSVITIALPPVKTASAPIFRTTDPAQRFCLVDPNVVVPLQSAAELFATEYAHDLEMVFDNASGMRSIPVELSPLEGGVIRSQKKPSNALTASAGSTDTSTTPDEHALVAHLRGYWGFDRLEGPTLAFQRGPSEAWTLNSPESITADANTNITVSGRGTACVHKVDVTGGGQYVEKLLFTALDGDRLSVQLPFTNRQPGSYTLAIEQYGQSSMSFVPFTAYEAAPRLEGILLGADASRAILLGKGLSLVTAVNIGTKTYTPEPALNDGDGLQLRTSDPQSMHGENIAVAKLSDGRVVTVPVRSETPGAMLTLLSMHTRDKIQNGAVEVELKSPDTIPLHSVLHFVVRSVGPFPRTQTIEVATADGALHAVLSVSDNSLILEDDHTAVAVLDLDKAFGESGFGPLRFRSVPGDGTYGSWFPLGTLVRRPTITGLHCIRAGGPTCIVEGSSLFLARAFSATPGFEKPLPVPEDFDGTSFAVPVPSAERGTAIYIQLRDGPDAIAVIRAAPGLSR